MDLVLKNPFRVLGLPATSSARDIAKRISDLETFAEIGKAKSYPNDFPFFGELDRSIESIKDASRKIEQIEGRLFHSFFWFRSADSVDEIALESLSSGNTEEALSLWSKQLIKNGKKKYTWNLNRCVLNLLNASRIGLDVKKMDEALEDLGFVIDDYLEGSIQDVLGGNESSVNRKNLGRKVVDAVLEVVNSYGVDTYGKNAIRLVGSFWSFPLEASDYASSRIINPLIEEVNDAIKVSERLRENNDLEALKAKNRLDGVELIIKNLREVLDEEDIRFQSVANAYADEIRACAVLALNTFNNPKLAYMLIQWALSLPSFSRVKERIEENTEIIKGWVEDDENDEIYGAIVKKLKVDLYTLNQASSMLEGMKAELSKIRAKVGSTDKHYIKTSSACAHRILGFLIDSVNTAQDKFTTGRNFTELQSTISQATGLTKKLLLLDIDEETRARVDKNLETIEGLNRNVNVATAERTNSSSIFEVIPGWLWVVGGVFLLSMFGK